MKKDMTVKEAADILSLHPETVRQLARGGSFPNAYKTGRGVHSSPIRIPSADVEAFRKMQMRVNR